MFVVFEGIDGSGKTSLSTGVAKALRKQGLRVEHVREGGKFASATVQRIREFGRDARNVLLAPEAELLFFLTRDAQLLMESTRPALERAEVVIADRYFFSAEILATYGRGLPQEKVTPLVQAASDGLEPDLVVLVDVDPHVARARRKVAKIINPDDKPPSRKGLAGNGLGVLLRRGYLEHASRARERWIAVDNSGPDLHRLVERVTEVVRARMASPGHPLAEVGDDLRPRPRADPSPRDAEQAKEAFLEWIDARSGAEPGLAAYFLAGLAGPGVDERRQALVGRVPAVVAFGLRGLVDHVSWELRRTLKDQAPGWVARSLVGPAAGSEAAWGMLFGLSEAAAEDVLRALDGRAEEKAWALRGRLRQRAPEAAVASLAGLDSSRAWEARDAWLRDRGGLEALSRLEVAAPACLAVSRLDGERAWAIRRAAIEAAPVAALRSIAGLVSQEAWECRAQFLERAARVVFPTIAGMDHPTAWEMRHKMAVRCEEALESMVGLDGGVAWALREACQDAWPWSVLESLGPLGPTERGRALVERQLLRHPGDIAVWCRAAAFAAG